MGSSSLPLCASLVAASATKEGWASGSLAVVAAASSIAAATAGSALIELAKFLDVPQANIAFWEWSDKPPRSDLLPKMAKAFGVRLEELLVVATADQPIARRKGPIGEVQRTFEEVTKLPRRQQRKVLEMVQALVEQYKRKAS
jgi:hypothetical protein